MLGCWGWRNVSCLGSKQDGEGLGKTMGGEHPTLGSQGAAFPSVTLCFLVLVVVSSAEGRASMAGGGPVCTTAPLDKSLLLSWSLAKRAHRGQRLLPALQICAHPVGRCIPSFTASGVHLRQLGALESGAANGLCACSAPLGPKVWEAFCAHCLSHLSREHLC